MLRSVIGITKDQQRSKRYQVRIKSEAVNVEDFSDQVKWRGVGGGSNQTNFTQNLKPASACLCYKSSANFGQNIVVQSKKY